MNEYIEYLNIVNSTFAEGMQCDGYSVPLTDLDYEEEQPYGIQAGGDTVYCYDADGNGVCVVL